MSNFYFYHSDSSDYIRNVYNCFPKAKDHFKKEDTDFILVMQMGKYQELVQIKRLNPQIPMYTYVWDCYEWIWKYPRGYDWHAYGEVIKESDHVFVPSEGQRLRLLQHWGIPFSKSSTVKAYAQFFDHPTKRGDYVCNPLRDIPDKQNGWIEQICKELNIPYQHGGRAAGARAKTWEEYKDFIANARFIICPWYEASTGGMSLLEGYKLGKPVLICDSLYMGARDYFCDLAHYYNPDYKSMKEAVERVYHDGWKKYNYVDRMEEYTLYNFAKRLSDAIQEKSNGKYKPYIR